MISLYEALRIRVNEWRTGGYSYPEYSGIADILEWASDPDGSGFRLRPPQQRALEQDQTEIEKTTKEHLQGQFELLAGEIERFGKKKQQYLKRIMRQKTQIKAKK
jgi:hypothetical protein